MGQPLNIGIYCIFKTSRVSKINKAQLAGWFQYGNENFKLRAIDTPGKITNENFVSAENLGYVGRILDTWLSRNLETHRSSRDIVEHIGKPNLGCLQLPSQSLPLSLVRDSSLELRFEVAHESLRSFQCSCVRSRYEVISQRESKRKGIA